MAKKEKPKSGFAPQPAAPSSVQPAATVVDQQVSITAPGSDGPGNDGPPERKLDAEAPETTAGASGTSEAAAQGNSTPPVSLLTLAFPLPAEIPPYVLESAVVIVKAKSARGRWRAGRQFTREETSIPFPDLDERQIEALTADPELVVSLRVAKPD